MLLQDPPVGAIPELVILDANKQKVSESTALEEAPFCM